MPTPSPRPPTPADAAVLVSLAVVGSAVVRFGGGASVGGPPWLSVTVAGLCAIMFGIPALTFILHRGLETRGRLMAAGALVAALPLVVFAVSAGVGLYFRSGDWAPVAFALDRGLPIPLYGVVYWPRVLRLELQAVLFGAACGLLFWVFRTRHR